MRKWRLFFLLLLDKRTTHAYRHTLRKGRLSVSKETINKIDANVSLLTLLANSANNIARHLVYLLMYLKRCQNRSEKKKFVIFFFFFEEITSSWRMVFALLKLFYFYFSKFCFSWLIICVNVDGCR